MSSLIARARPSSMSPSRKHVLLIVLLIAFLFAGIQLECNFLSNKSEISSNPIGTSIRTKEKGDSEVEVNVKVDVNENENVESESIIASEKSPSADPSASPTLDLVPSTDPTSNPSLNPSSSPSTTKHVNNDIDANDNDKDNESKSSSQPCINLQDFIPDYNETIAVPSNLRLAFMGDSLTRYQYLSLAKFLTDGKWINPETEDYMIWKQGYADLSMMEWFNKTNYALTPYETCDCWRNTGLIDRPKVIENRYFYDDRDEYDNSVGLFVKLGEEIAGRSRWESDQVHAPHHINTEEKRENVTFTLNGMDFTQMVETFISQIRPKYNALVFNAGLWNHRFRNPQVQDQFLGALSSHNITSIYKTTTGMAGNVPSPKLKGDGGNYEHELCAKVDICYNISWTYHVPRTLYHDGVHFREPVYRRLNTQLLQLLDGRQVCDS